MKKKVMNMELLETMLKRRSCRSFNDIPVSDEEIDAIITAGLSSPTGHGYYPCDLIVVKDKELLNKLENTRVGGGKIIKESSVTVFVIGDKVKSETWIEDCSIILSNMHLMADSMGLGSCWIQGRLRTTVDGKVTDDFVKSVLNYPDNYELLGALAIGNIDSHPERHGEAFMNELKKKVHINKF